jgi:hypothetical protein
MTPLPDLPSLIAIVRTDASSDDPLDQLAQAARSVGEIEEVSDALLGHFVEGCRANGFSWSQISTVLGVSKQAVHKRFAGTAPTFERFTLRAQAVLGDAREQARALGQESVGTEHLLLALFDSEGSMAAQLFEDVGLNRESVLAKLSADPATGTESSQGSQSVSGEIGYSPRARTALRNALEEALKLGHNYVGTEHLLLALYDDPDALGARTLTSLGVSYDDLTKRLADKFAAMKVAKRGTA